MEAQRTLSALWSSLSRSGTPEAAPGSGHTRSDRGAVSPS